MSDARLSVRAAARETPKAPALLGRDLRVDFAELAALTEAKIRRLQASGASEPGVVLGLSPALDVESLLWILAAIELAVPIALLHPRLGARERAAAIARIPGLLLPSDEAVLGPSTGRLPATLSSLELGEERPLALFFTSGTSGEPKLAVLSRRAFVASAAMNAARLGWRSGDRWQLALPLAHVGGFSILVRCLIARRPMVLPSERDHFSGERLLEDLHRHEASLVSLVPTMFEDLLARGRPPPTSLRVVLLGGAPPRRATLVKAREAGWPVHCTYGLTEACASVSISDPNDPSSSLEGAGRPLAGLELRISDGQIQLRGDSLFSGYLDADRVRLPFEAGGWFPTGDLGHVDEVGVLHVDARRTDLILSGGENIYPREIERVLEAQPGVRGALVVGVPDERWGERPVALVERGPGFDEASVRRAVDAELAAFKRPSRWLYVDVLPRNVLGKLDRAGARARLGSEET